MKLQFRPNSQISADLYFSKGVIEQILSFNFLQLLLVRSDSKYYLSHHQ